MELFIFPRSFPYSNHCTDHHTVVIGPSFGANTSYAWGSLLFLIIITWKFFKALFDAAQMQKGILKWLYRWSRICFYVLFGSSHKIKQFSKRAHRHLRIHLYPLVWEILLCPRIYLLYPFFALQAICFFSHKALLTPPLCSRPSPTYLSPKSVDDVTCQG